MRPEQNVRLKCRGADPELLFVDWLNQVIYAMATQRMLFSHFDVHIGGNGELQAEIRAKPWIAHATDLQWKSRAPLSPSSQ